MSEVKLRELARQIDELEKIIACLPCISVPRAGLDEVEQLNSILAHLSPVSRAELSRLAHFSRQLLADTQQTIELTSALQALIFEMLNYMWRRLSGEKAQISLSTRQALWQRLWLIFEWRFGVNWSETPVDQELLKEVETHLIAINWICAQFKSDPHWSPKHVLDRKTDFFTEASLAHLLTESSELEICLAPFEADIIAGLDLSVKRHSPRARAWVQVSLSGEEHVHDKKVQQLQRSAASCILSPWTIAQKLEETGGIHHRLWTLFESHSSNTWTRQTAAREIALHLRSILGQDLSALDIQDIRTRAVRDELMRQCLLVITDRLGYKAKRSYKTKRHPRKVPPTCLLHHLGIVPS